MAVEKPSPSLLNSPLHPHLSQFSLSLLRIHFVIVLPSHLPHDMLGAYSAFALKPFRIQTTVALIMEFKFIHRIEESLPSSLVFTPVTRGNRFYTYT
jgi:hypothetical protein